MNRFVLALSALALLLPACGGGGGSTPESTFEAMKSAAMAKDFDAFLDCMSPADLKKMEDEFQKQKDQMKSMPAEMREMMAKQFGMTADELENSTARQLFVKAMEKTDAAEMEKVKNSEIIETKIDGDKATLKIRSGDKEDTIHMVLVDGKWYMSGMN